MQVRYCGHENRKFVGSKTQVGNWQKLHTAELNDNYLLVTKSDVLHIEVLMPSIVNIYCTIMITAINRDAESVNIV